MSPPKKDASSTLISARKLLTVPENNLQWYKQLSPPKNWVEEKNIAPPKTCHIQKLHHQRKPLTSKEKYDTSKTTCVCKKHVTSEKCQTCLKTRSLPKYYLWLEEKMLITKNFWLEKKSPPIETSSENFFHSMEKMSHFEKIRPKKVFRLDKNLGCFRKAVWIATVTLNWISSEEKWLVKKDVTSKKYVSSRNHWTG